MVHLGHNSRKILENRYLLRDDRGFCMETPDELFQRVAKAIVSAEIKWGDDMKVKLWEEKFYSVMSNLLFLPNSPTLMNAGTTNGQLSACFVLPVEDSVEGIFTTLKQAALIQQSGGGTGFNFSKLRPRNDKAIRTRGVASGPLAFIKMFNAATDHIKQAGKRRGANMGILNIDHPDIEEFVIAKRVPDVLNNFNLSVGITDKFMKAVENDQPWDLIHPNSKKILKTLPAKILWDSIVESAWKSGDPGLIFIDTVNSSNPTPKAGIIESTNPCGEIPLLPYESCNLGSLNLSQFIRQTFNVNEIDWNLLEDVIKTAIRFLDNVIDVNHYLIPEIKNATLQNRKIGLGVMGWADLLIRLGIPYDSDKAVRTGEQVMQFIQEKSRECSVELANERGMFSGWANSIYTPLIATRNATCTAIAPAGTISLIADTSSGIEPLFALAFHRDHVLDDESLYFVNDLFINYLEVHGYYSQEIIDQVSEEGTAKNINALPSHVKEIFKTSMEISPEWHLKHQLAFQKYTDNAVSKTINLPEDCSIAEVDAIYRSAWRQKAKGITVYRYNSKQKQVMYRGIKSAIKTCKACIQ